MEECQDGGGEEIVEGDETKADSEVTGVGTSK